MWVAGTQLFGPSTRASPCEHQLEAGTGRETVTRTQALGYGMQAIIVLALGRIPASCSGISITTPNAYHKDADCEGQWTLDSATNSPAALGQFISLL